jgi:hypothetical protein
MASAVASHSCTFCSLLSIAYLRKINLNSPLGDGGNMIAIDNKLISDQIIEEQFVCDLSKCKGGCCEDGDAGAPLETAELDELISNYNIIEPYLTEAGKAQLKSLENIHTIVLMAGLHQQ